MKSLRWAYRCSSLLRLKGCELSPQSVLACRGLRGIACKVETISSGVQGHGLSQWPVASFGEGATISAALAGIGGIR